MDIQPIKTETDYQAALKRINAYFNAAEGTSEADMLDVLAILVEDWETKHYPVTLPHPIAAIEFALDHNGLGREVLLPLLGTPARVSEVLGGQRRLTLRMIRYLHTNLGIPLAVLMQDYPVQGARPTRGRPRRKESSGAPARAVTIGGS